jgi:hypothetical protein
VTVDVTMSNAMSESPRAMSVSRVDAPSYDEFHRLIVPSGRPVVITGALRRSDDHPLWSFDRFTEDRGAQVVSTQLRFGARWQDIRSEHMEVRRVIDLMRLGEQRALAVALNTFPELERCVRPPAYVPADRRMTRFLFVTPRELVTPFHYDVCHNLLAQFCGRKRIILVDARYSAELRHPPPWKPYFWTSPIDPDDSGTPLARVPRYECVLEPTDVLFIPGGFRHHVRVLEDSISVASFWEHSLRQRATVHALAVLGRRPGSLAEYLTGKLLGRMR